jgi:hypothetical protein
MEEKNIQTNEVKDCQNVKKTVKHLLCSQNEKGETELIVSGEPDKHVGFSWEISEFLAQNFAKWKQDVVHALDVCCDPALETCSSVDYWEFIWNDINHLLKYIEIDLLQGPIHRIPCIILNDQVQDMFGYSDEYLCIKEDELYEEINLKKDYLFSCYRWGAVAMYVLHIDNGCSFTSDLNKNFVVKKLDDTPYYHALYYSSIHRHKITQNKEPALRTSFTPEPSTEIESNADGNCDD